MTDLFGDKELRALSWKEPFASLMLHGKIETRTWATDYRGLVLICASKKPYNREQVYEIAGGDQYRHIEEIIEKKNIDADSTLGHAIAVGELVDCRLMQLKDEEACFVEYYSDLWCHVYEDVRPIKPIPFKGVQGWKKLDKSFHDQIKYLDKK